jgi:hypothetical protein
MASLVGDLEAYSTWGRFRFPLGNGGEDRTLGSHNTEWHSGFKTTAGNGFFRCDNIQVFALYQPYVVFTGSDFYLNDATDYIVLDQREADELIGETVTVTGPDSFVITADYLTAAGQAVTSTGGAPIISIGLLTTF